jgi:hypothetical protein
VVGWLVGAQTVLQDSVADCYRGRILGTYGTTSVLTRLGGMGLAGVLGDRLGVVPVLNVSGGLHIVAGVGVLASCTPHAQCTHRLKICRSALADGC